MLYNETGRNAPLPFMIGVGSSSTVETIIEIRQILQTYAFVPVDPTVPTGGTGGGAGCVPSNNQMCVPTATVVLAAQPGAAVRCAT